MKYKIKIIKNKREKKKKYLIKKKKNGIKNRKFISER